MEINQTKIDNKSDRTSTESVKVEAFQPKTKLGQQLWEIRQKIVASGEPLLGWTEIEQEMNERRGGQI